MTTPEPGEIHPDEQYDAEPEEWDGVLRDDDWRESDVEFED